MENVFVSVRDVVAEISAAFQASPLEIALIFGSILALLGFLTIYWLVSRRRARRQQEAQAEKTYEELRGRLNLSAKDEKLVDRLTRYLDAPVAKYALLANRGVFSSCARKLIEDDPDAQRAVASLRVHLGFEDARPDQKVSSTAEIPVNASVLVMPDRGRGIGARVAERDDKGITVVPAKAGVDLAAESPVRLMFHNNAGVFTFATTVATVDQGRMRLRHAENPEQIQRRRYYRRPLRRPVYIRPLGSEDEPEESELLDIGGGGASLVNPGGKYSPAEETEISFSPHSSRSFSVAGSVVRTSRGGSVILLRFLAMRPSVQDRIYRLLFGT